MYATRRTVFLALAFAFVAGSLLGGGAEARRDRPGQFGTSDSSLVDVIKDGPDLPVDPDILDPEPDACDEDLVEDVLNGYLPETVTLKKSNNFWAKLTVKDGVTVIECDLATYDFEVRFNNTTIKTYGRVGGLGGWNHLASISCQIRVSFAVNFVPPSTLVLSNLKVLAINCENSPNWLDTSLVTSALNKIFPDSITISV